MTIIERTSSPQRRKVCRLMNFLSEVIPLWIKDVVTGSVGWTFLLYLVSVQGMNLVKGFQFEPCPWQTSPTVPYLKYDDSLPLILGGWFVIWLLSFLFIRKKPTD